MGIFDRFRGAISKSSQATNEAYNKLVYRYIGNNLISSTENDDTYINKGYRFNSTIYSLVNLLSKTASTIPFQVYEVKNDNELKRYKSLTSGIYDSSSLLNSKIVHKKALVQVDDTDLHQILDRPNPSQSYTSWIQEIVAFGSLTGNRYIYGIAPETGQNTGKFQELYVLPSQVVEIHSGGLMKPVKEYTLEYNGTYKIPAELICHIKNYNPYYDGSGSHLYGMSPLKAGLRSMDANNEALTTGVKYLQNQTARGMLVSDEGDITESQAKQLKDKFRNTYQGSNNAGDVIITPKKLSWVNFGLNASDLSLIEQYNATIKDLCNIYNIPVQLLNNTDSATYNNMKEAKKALYQNAVIPEMVKIREELNRWLTPKYGDKLYIDFDFSAIPELQEETEKIVGQMSQSWWLTPNEKRAAMNYGVDEEADKMNQYYIPANLLPLDPSSDIDDIADLIEEQKMQKTEVRGMNDVFTTIREARDRAEQMGGSGYHQHLHDGNTVYMPFETHEEYEAAKEGRLDEYYTDRASEGDHMDFDDAVYEMYDMELKAPQISANMETALRNKVDDHNEKYGDDPAKRATYSMLARSFVRGIGAYRTNPSSVRPNVSNEQQWALGRVNGLLYALRSGRFRSTAYDTDLLPEAHSLSSKKEVENKKYDNYPQGATNNAQRVLDWDDKYELRGKMGTDTGWARARQLAARRPLSQSDVNEIYSFLRRHEQNAEIAEEFRGTPWNDKGYVMYNAWGGRAMLSFVERNRSANQDD
jgi:HK97 family phage portal protein